MLAGSVTMASSLMRPWHLGQARTFTPNVRARSSAHGRYPPARFGVSGSPIAWVIGGGFGTMRDLHGLAAASIPAYLTVCKRGGGTLVANRQSRDSGSISTATVPSAYAFLSVVRTKPSGRRSTRSCATAGRST